MDLNDANRREAAFYTIAADTGYPKGTVAWIAGAVCIGSHASDGKEVSLGAEALCAMLVSDIDALKPGDLERALRDAGINSSSDIGRIVYALVEAGVITTSEGDQQSHFDDVFNTDHLDAFLSRAGIRRRRSDIRQFKRQISWALYGIGFAIILLNYAHVVSNRVGWTGWVIAMVGVVLSWLPNPKTPRFPVRSTEH